MYYIRILMIHIHTHLKGSVCLKHIHIQTHLKGNSHNDASGTRAAFHKLREQYIHTPHLKKYIMHRRTLKGTVTTWGQWCMRDILRDSRTFTSPIKGTVYSHPAP